MADTFLFFLWDCCNVIYYNQLCQNKIHIRSVWVNKPCFTFAGAGSEVVFAVCFFSLWFRGAFRFGPFVLKSLWACFRLKWFFVRCSRCPCLLLRSWSLQGPCIAPSDARVHGWAGAVGLNTGKHWDRAGSRISFRRPVSDRKAKPQCSRKLL